MPPGLQVTSGIGTVSGIAAVNALPVTLYGASGDVITDFSGALNVNISGGTIATNVSGNVVQISGQFVFTSGGGGAIAAYQSGTLVGISGGQGAISGTQVIVQTSGVTQVVIAFSGGTAFGSDTGSGANLRIAIFAQAGSAGANVGGGGVTDATAQQSALFVLNQNMLTNATNKIDFMRSVDAISGGKQSGLGILAAEILAFDYSGATHRQIGTAASGSNAILVTVTSGGGSPNISGGVTVSGGVQISGFVGVLSGGTIPVAVVSGSVASISGQIVIVSGNYVNIASSGMPLTNISGYLNVNPFKQWPSYGTFGNKFSGSNSLNLLAIQISGYAASSSGLVIELQRFEIGIQGSGAGGQRIDLYLTDNTGTASGEVYGPKKLYVGNPTSIANVMDGEAGTILSGGAIQSTICEVQITPIISGSITRDTYIYNFPTGNGFQPPIIGSGYGFLLTMTSGMAIGVVNLYWLEKYLS